MAIPMSAEDLESRFLQAVRQARLLTPNTNVLAGVSGGADSVAMLYLLNSLGRHGLPLGIHVAHLNHQLRGAEAEKDAEFVRQTSAGLGLDCTVSSVDVRQRADDEGISIEQAARHCRYEFFERVCLRIGAQVVALAHQADDNAETILHRFVRGTGLRGLGGIPVSRPVRPGSGIRVIRPILSFRRSEIEEYLHARGVAFRHDATNDADSYTRNRIRNEILPVLRDRINPQAVEAINRLSEQARGVDEYLSGTARRMLDSVMLQRDDQEIVLLVTSLARKPQVIRMQLVREAMLLLGAGEAEINYGHLKAAAAMTEESHGNKAMDLPGGVRVIRRYDRLMLQRLALAIEESEPPPEIRVAPSGRTLLAGQGIELSIEALPVDQTMIAEHVHRAASRDQVSWEEWVDADEVHFPLTARSRRPGDRFLPLGMSEVKKLSDFFIDEKIDADVRERTVLLCDRLGPIWVVPLRIDQRVRLSEATRRVMRLTARQVSPKNP